MPRIAIAKPPCSMPLSSSRKAFERQSLSSIKRVAIGLLQPGLRANLVEPLDLVGKRLREAGKTCERGPFFCLPQGRAQQCLAALEVDADGGDLDDGARRLAAHGVARQ